MKRHTFIKMNSGDCVMLMLSLLLTACQKTPATSQDVLMGTFITQTIYGKNAQIAADNGTLDKTLSKLSPRKQSVWVR